MAQPLAYKPVAVDYLPQVPARIVVEGRAVLAVVGIAGVDIAGVGIVGVDIVGAGVAGVGVVECVDVAKQGAAAK